MATTLQLRRGNTAAASAFTGASGEVFIDTTKNTALVHDGSTQGGHELALASDVSSKLGASGGHITATTDSSSVSTGALIIDGGLGVAKNITASTVTSTVTTGTAPFSVASTTAVSNLNADMLDGNHASAFSPAAGSTSLVCLGTVTTGTWNGTTVGVAHGGTGATTLTTNAVLLGNGTSALQAVAPGTSGNVLVSDGSTWTSGAANYAPTGGSTSITCLGTVTTGTWNATEIGVAYGGTGLTSLTAGSVVVGNGSKAVSLVAPGTAGYVLTSTGTGWAACAASGGGGGASLDANYNLAIGTGNLVCNTTGVTNVAIGPNVLTLNTTGSNNFAVGCNALKVNTIGSSNFAVGCNALAVNTTGNFNFAVGCNALAVNTIGCSNVAIGKQALPANTTGFGNIAVGEHTMMCNTKGSMNVAIGYLSMYCNVTGNYNIAIGSCAMKGGQGGGSANVAIGLQALQVSCHPGNNNVAVGRSAMNFSGCNDSTVAIGYNALNTSTGGMYNVAIGESALGKYGIAYVYNAIAIGSYALGSASAGNNIGIGTQAGNAVGLGQRNVVIGGSALSTNTGANDSCDSIAIGFSSMLNACCSATNIAIGSCSLYNTAMSCNNISIGDKSLYQSVTGNDNIAIGANTLYKNSNANKNIAIGTNALTTNPNGSNNIAIGTNALRDKQADTGCVIINSGGTGFTNGTYTNVSMFGPTCDCYSANITVSGNSVTAVTLVCGLYTNQSNNVYWPDCGCIGWGYGVDLGSCLIAVGTGGSDNVAIGSNSLSNNENVSGNIAIGSDSLYANTTGTGNTAIGYKAAKNVIEYSHNTAIGYEALCLNNGEDSTAIGYRALSRKVLDAVTFNIANAGMGYNSGTYTNVQLALVSGDWAGSSGVFVDVVMTDATPSPGYKIDSITYVSGDVIAGQSLYLPAEQFGYGMNASVNASITIGASHYRNTAVGSCVLYGNTTGIENTAIGYLAGICNTTGSNNTFIGSFSDGASPTASNTITLGNSSITTLRAQVTSITALSDARDKTNVQDIPVGLEFINALRPVKFEWNTRDGAKVGIEDAGFIAQEVAEVEDTFAAANWLSLVYKENPEKLELSAGKLIPVLVKAIQQLTARVEELENK